jgi:hypothetical protein
MLFYGENFKVLFLYPISNFFSGIHMKVIINEFSAKDTPPMLF